MGLLVKGSGMARLPVAVSIEPEQPEPGYTVFRLRVDGTGCRGGTYVGKVKATTEEGTPTEVFVWITVP
jgi:hypothetical protein